MVEEKQCPKCEVKSKALHFHMKSHDKPEVKADNTVPGSEVFKIDLPKPKVTLEDVANLIVGMNERLGKVEDAQKPKTATDQIQEHMDKASEPKKESDGAIQEKFLHPSYKEVIENTLGNQFEAWQTYEETDDAHFMFHILIPPQLSPSKDNKSGKKVLPDIRSKAISHAEGINGVKEWCQKVRGNLNQYYSRNAIPSPFAEAAIT